jgi:hypothetical protein
MSVKYPDHGPGHWPAAGSRASVYLLANDWLVWLALPESSRQDDPDYHQHEYRDTVLPHRHVRGSEPHDHEPRMPGG